MSSTLVEGGALVPGYARARELWAEGDRTASDSRGRWEK